MSSTRRRAGDAYPRPESRWPLGHHGLRVSPYCLGAVADPATLEAAYDAGINFFFVTTDMHWPLYQGTRSGLAQLLARSGVSRDDIVVVAVSYVAQPEFTIHPMREVLACVPGLQRFDAFVIGGAYSHDFMLRLHAAQRRLDERASGITAVGASFHDRRACQLAYNTGLVDIAYVRYNARHRGAEAEVFARATEDGSRTLLYNFNSTRGFIAPDRYPELGLSRNHWKPALTDHYRFALAQPRLDGLLIGPRDPDQLAEFLAAVERGPLDAEEREYLIDLCDLADGYATHVDHA